MRFPLSLNLTMIKYLFKKGLSSQKQFPLVLMLEPLHACNLACRGCGKIREYQETLDKQLTAEECLAASRECGAPVVSISGGEPLLHPEIDEIIRGLLQMGRHIYLCTNGLKLADFVARNTPHPHLFINVHLDGMSAHHDGLVNRPGVFQAATEAIKKGKQKGFTITTNTTVFKMTEEAEIIKLFSYLESLQVDGFFISPGFCYDGLTSENFLSRQEVYEKFQFLDVLKKKFRFFSTPLYMDFLQGKRNYACAPWGTVTYNPLGWKAPCYLITDTHYSGYQQFINTVDWEYYRSGKDPRCRQCMMHSGFEPAAVLDLKNNKKDIWKMLVWNLT